MLLGYSTPASAETCNCVRLVCAFFLEPRHFGWDKWWWYWYLALSDYSIYPETVICISQPLSSTDTVTPRIMVPPPHVRHTHSQTISPPSLPPNGCRPAHSGHGIPAGSLRGRTARADWHTKQTGRQTADCRRQTADCRATGRSRPAWHGLRIDGQSLGACTPRTHGVEGYQREAARLWAAGYSAEAASCSELCSVQCRNLCIPKSDRFPKIIVSSPRIFFRVVLRSIFVIIF